MSTINPLIAAVQQAGSALELLQSTAELARSGDPGAAPTLVEVLSFNNPGAAVAAVDGLIAIGPPAVDHLLQLDPRNYGARAWAVRALAGIGDVRGLDLLIEALLDDVGPSVRRAAARGLGSLQLMALDPLQRSAIEQRCLEALLRGCSDGEWVVRYAVAMGLEGLALSGGWPADHRGHGRTTAALTQLSDAAHEDAPVVRLRAALALQRLSH
ncbi:MAG: HEAT repeat domain-containing protein [Cyanobacteriota bacterium]|nr:HEAT repeat domain-containing protein [Cyanobacteriota bacterium]